MKGKDLVKYITEHSLEEAEINYSEVDPLQFVITIPADKVSDEREIVYDFSRDMVYEKYLAITEVTYAHARALRNINEARIKEVQDDHT